jgi:hypothetical protein
VSPIKNLAKRSRHEVVGEPSKILKSGNPATSPRNPVTPHQPSFRIFIVLKNHNRFRLESQERNKPSLNDIRMGNLMYTIAVILALVWGIAFFGYGYSGATHLVLAAAVVVMVIGLTRRTNE